MTTAADPLATVNYPAVPDVGIGLDEDDDEDMAGYQAMMSELPTIVSMSGLLEGDFDELNEIQNLLAPVSDDDEEGHAAAAAAVAAEAAEEAYIQAMVPNPIPQGDTFESGMDISATVAALDENLGFPSAALVTTTEMPINPPTYDTASSTESTSLSVRAPTKRIHKQLEVGMVTPVGPNSACHPPRPKKARQESNSLAASPAALRTSLDGVSAPNPLLFGRPIQIPSQAKLVTPEIPTKPNVAEKLSLKPRTLPKLTRPPPALYPIIKPLEVKRDPPKLLKARNPIVPEVISSYPVPAGLASKFNNINTRPRPLCKLIFRGKIDPVVKTPGFAIARVPAPPQKNIQTGTTCDNKNNNNSATASNKKKASNSKKKKSSSKTKKTKTGAVKAKKAGTKPVLKAPEGSNQKKSTASKTKAAGEPKTSPPAAPSSAPPKVEELMVANPLANVLPVSAPVQMPPPFKKPSSTPAASATKPVVVSSNSSATDEEAPEDLAPSAETKKPNGKPLTPEEKAQACRDRNRQHARNTRLRKKAYVEELKKSLMDVVEERDRLLNSHQEEVAQKEQRRTRRKRALQDFLQLRGHNEREEAKWSQLLKDSKAFRLTLPATSKFQTTVHPASADSEQVLVGLQDIMADANHFASFLQSLGGANNELQKENSVVRLEYQSEESPLLVDGSMGILSWKATTYGAVSLGAKSELLLSGSIRAVFCAETDKLVSARLMFDTGVIQAQLSQSQHV